MHDIVVMLMPKMPAVTALLGLNMPLYSSSSDIPHDKLAAWETAIGWLAASHTPRSLLHSPFPGTHFPSTSPSSAQLPLLHCTAHVTLQ